MRSSKLLFNILLFLALLSPAAKYATAQKITTSKYIVVDQFGYLSDSKKIAVIRNPQEGFDASESFTPGSIYSVLNLEDSTEVLSGTPVQWKNGAMDPSSGDKIWHFDFSEVKSAGRYVILDVDSSLSSYEFEIGEDVYEEVMRQAFRTFFYQRSGFAKELPYANEEWVDGASHLQDKTARNFLKKYDAATTRDVSGGWYDAGDFNKYTSWTSNYVIEFMKAFIENPGVWGDDTNIPESGNNIPDILDEAKWGVDHLLRLQEPNGSMLSVVGASHASPPSAAKGATYYGNPNTSGTLNAAAAFAIASKVYRSTGMQDYADSLQQAAIKAWDWAKENPNVLFYNNTGNTKGLAAGQQETNDYGRLMAKLKAASFLYEITGEKEYKTFFEGNYQKVHLMEWTFAYPFETDNQQVLLYYTTLPGITSTVKSNIRAKYKSAMDGTHNFAAITSQTDPYMAYMKDYVWGSNSTKARQGLMFTDFIKFGINNTKNELAKEAAEFYIHYIHGVNPLNLVYLSNMYNYGAENSVNEFYHSWFKNGSVKWDRVGESTYGPAPGFLTGGPNPGYDWDGCCPGSCGSSGNNAMCYDETISPPKDQPNQKSYKDFNNSWPLNSWSVTENSCGYQISYIRLLASFLPEKYDCSGTYNGNASYDACGVCSGGTTGIEPESNSDNCLTTSSVNVELQKPEIFPNPAEDVLNIRFKDEGEYKLAIINHQGQVVYEDIEWGNSSINIKTFQSGNYIVKISGKENVWQEKFIKL